MLHTTSPKQSIPFSNVVNAVLMTNSSRRQMICFTHALDKIANKRFFLHIFEHNVLREKEQENLTLRVQMNNIKIWSNTVKARPWSIDFADTIASILETSETTVKPVNILHKIVSCILKRNA